MHELSLVQALVDRVQEEVRARRGRRVHRIQVQIGSLSGVEPTLFASAYELLRDGSACQGAALEVETVEARWACPACARPIAPGAPLHCPSCACAAHLVCGGEIVLSKIEMEVA